MKTDVDKIELHVWFRHFRDHQRRLMANDAFMLTTFADGRASQRTFASAPFGEHALSAFLAAKRQIAFHRRMREEAARNFK
jgi:hypothetical protein